MRVVARSAWTPVALGGAVLVLVVATWFDHTYLPDAQHHAQATFDMSGFTGPLVAGSLVVGGSVLLLWSLAWRAASLVVGLAYVIAGGFIAALPWLAITLASSREDAPPILPEPLVLPLTDLWFATSGTLNAAGSIAAAMLITGIAVLVRGRRSRMATPAGPVAPGTEESR